MDFGAFCVLQSINGLADWYDESRASNAKRCDEWQNMESGDFVPADLVKSTLGGLIPANREVVDRNLVLIGIWTDGRETLIIKSNLTLPTRETDHSTAHIPSLSVVAAKSESSSATLCPKVSAWWIMLRSLSKPWDSMSSGWSGTKMIISFHDFDIQVN